MPQLPYQTNEASPAMLHRSLATLMITFVLSLVGNVFIYIHQKLDGFSICFSFFFNIHLLILIGGFLLSYPVRRLTRPPRVRLGVIRGLSGDTGAQHWYQCCH